MNELIVKCHQKSRNRKRTLWRSSGWEHHGRIPRRN